MVYHWNANSLTRREWVRQPRSQEPPPVTSLGTFEPRLHPRRAEKQLQLRLPLPCKFQDASPPIADPRAPREGVVEVRQSCIEDARGKHPNMPPRRRRRPRHRDNQTSKQQVPPHTAA